MRSNRSSLGIAAAGAATLFATFATFATLPGLEKDARACGGCFAPPAENESIVTDHRMVLSVSSKQTTLYDQIRYQGAPSSFAWVLPVADSNAAKLGLSADVVFASLDAMTATKVQQPPLNCPTAPTDCSFGKNAGSASPTAAEDGPGGVTVNKHEVVGPYVTDYLHSTDPQALNSWLTSHGYSIPADVAPVIAAYVKEHFDFIAMKLVPGQGVASMRPVRVSTPGAAPTLPLRMVAAGTGATVGITLWVIGDGRYETSNFPFFTINSADITWDWAQSKSDYADLRKANNDALGGRGWEIESSLTFAQSQIANVIESGGQYFGGGFGGAVPAYDAGSDYLPVGSPAGDDAGSDAGPPYQSAADVRADDLATLFAGIDPANTQITRTRADLVHASLDRDLLLRASADQTTLSNVRYPAKEAGQPSCPVYDGCEIVGQAPRDQAAAQTAANNTARHESFSCAASAMPIRPQVVAGLLLGALGIFFLRRRRGA